MEDLRWNGRKRKEWILWSPGDGTLSPIAGVQQVAH